MSDRLRLTASFDDGPQDSPVLVLGNSLGTTRRVWEPHEPALGARFRLLLYELPGHDGLAAPPGPYTIAELGAGVLALLDAFGIGRASYCGISLGGMIGMWLAAHAPDRIDRLGLVCTSAYLPPADGWLARAAKVRAEGMAAVTGQSIGRWFTPEFAARWPALMGSFATDLEHASPDGYAGCCEAIAALDLRADLRSIAAPTLVISGGRDPATPPEHGAAIAAGIAGARQLVIPDGSHLATISVPHEVSAALLGHLDAPQGRPG